MRVLRKLYRDLTHMILLMIHSHFLQQSHLIRKCIKNFGLLVEKKNKQQFLLITVLE